jgi:hypothetical protein
MSKREKLLTQWLSDAASAAAKGLGPWPGDDPRYVALDLNAENADLRAQLAREREAVNKMREAVAELHKAGEKIIQECFQYRHDDGGLSSSIALWDALVAQLKTEKLHALATPEPAKTEGDGYPLLSNGHSAMCEPIGPNRCDCRPAKSLSEKPSHLSDKKCDRSAEPCGCFLACHCGELRDVCRAVTHCPKPCPKCAPPTPPEKKERPL